MKLLITVPWNAEHVAKVQAAFPQVEFATALTEEEALREAPDAEVIFGRVGRDVFLAAKRLRWIQCQGAGVETMIAIPELVAGDVVLTTTSGAHAATIAEHFFGLLIALARRFPAVYKAQQSREWIPWGEWSDKIGPEPVALLGRTLGIIGLGNIGRAIAERAAAFDMEIIAVDACAVSRPDCVADLWPTDDLPRLLECSDVVVVTVPGTPQTADMLDARALGLMKQGAFLLVVSRGGIVNERALLRLLQTGHLAGAALDATDSEPLLADNPLWDAPNLLITPHYAGRSAYTTAAATAIFQENLGRYLRGQPLINLVDKQRGF